MTDSITKILVTCIREIEYILSKDNNIIDMLQRNLNSISGHKPHIKDQLDCMVHKFNKERMKALLAIIKTKILMAEARLLINDICTKSKRNSSQKRKADASYTSVSNKKPRFKIISSSPSSESSDEGIRGSPPISHSKSTSPHSQSGSNSSQHNNALTDQLPPQNRLRDIKNEENISKFNINEIVANNLFPINEYPMPNDSIGFYGSEDAVPPDVELSTQQRSNEINQVTNINTLIDIFSSGILKKSDTPDDNLSANIKPAKHNIQPNKFNLKKFLELHSTSKPVEGHQNNVKNDEDNIQEPNHILTKEKRHIPVPPAPTTPKRGTNFIPVASTSKAPPVAWTLQAPPVVSTSNALPFASTSIAPSVAWSSKALPVESVSKAPPVAWTSKAPPVVSTSNASPVASSSRAPSAATSKNLPVESASKAPPVAWTSKAPPVASTSKVSSAAWSSKTPPVEFALKVPPVPWTSKALPVTSTSKVSPVTSTSKAPPVASTSKSAQVTSTSKDRSIECTSKDRPVESSLKGRSVESMSNGLPVESTSKARQVESTSKARQVESTSKAGQVESTSKARQVVSTSKARQVESSSKARQVESTSKASSDYYQARPSAYHRGIVSKSTTTDKIKSSNSREIYKGTYSARP